MSKATSQQLRDEAICRSVFYGTMALGLHPPTPTAFAELTGEDTRLALGEAACFLPGANADGKADLALDGAPASVDLPGRAQAWLGSCRDVSLEELQTSYGRLFAHTARGLVCPYETEYGNEGLFQQPQQLARIAGFYQAFGLAVRSTEGERADHASCELEFLDFLSRKEAYALEAGDAAMLEETQKAVRLFLKDHAGRFGRAFGRLLAEKDADGFFGRLGELLFDFLTLECHRLGIEAGPPLLRLRSGADDNVPMACASESDADSELVQLQTDSQGHRSLAGVDRDQ